MLGPVCLGHRVSGVTLCPLGHPEKAIGHESQIEPWLPPCNRCACQFRESTGVVTIREMKLLGWQNQIASPLPATSRVDGAESQSKPQKPPRRLQGLDVEANIASASGRRGNISLDITCYENSGKSFVFRCGVLAQPRCFHARWCPEGA